MNRGQFNDFINTIGQYRSSNDYKAVDASNRLGRFALDELWLELIGMVRPDHDATDNDYSSGWTGKYGITSKEQFLASPDAQGKAFGDVLDKAIAILQPVLHYDGQTLNGQEISTSGMLGAAFLTDVGDTLGFVKYGEDDPEPGQHSVKTTIARFNGYATPYGVDQDHNYTFLGSDGPDMIRGYEGKDYFVAKGGDDKFDGGGNVDTIRLPLTRAEYTVTGDGRSAEWHIKRQLDAGSMEHKKITNVELIEFAGGETIDLRKLQSAAPDPITETVELQLEGWLEPRQVPISQLTLEVNPAASGAPVAKVGVQEGFLQDDTLSS
ncbi:MULTISPECIES: hypothetical protein [unclassified Chelatococcus]|uniref:hypothetical protein n=1 Tax=unclassified Chelatococcus TaxID=2638111 RepID=UPI001BCC35E1|nr:MULTISPECIES: hypothetical protein [unclassified Chelatococcus]MBS7698668.1 hypothetical protein [Chelatococcus sp. YT9]MBX3554750.1 hypothetical protein [Chelatococcus sp.]